MPRRRHYTRPDWADEFEAYGNEIAPDGTIVVYHATTAAKAKKILEEGFLRRPANAPDSYGVYFSISPEVAENYGDGTLVKLRVPVEDLGLDDIFPSTGRMDFHARTYQGIYIPIELEAVPGNARENPSQVAGWITPNGEFIPIERGREHFHTAAKRLKMKPTPRATRTALKKGWVRLGDMTVQFSLDHQEKALIAARDFYREVFGNNPPSYDIMVEWNIEGEMWDPEYTLVSYQIPVTDFLAIDGVSDLMRYPHQRIYTETWGG